MENWIDPVTTRRSDWAGDKDLDFTEWMKANDPTGDTLGDPTLTSTETTPHSLGVKTPLLDLFPSGRSEWQWTAPGDAVIYRADYEDADYGSDSGSGLGAGCIVEGLRSKPNGRFQTQYKSAPGDQSATAAKQPTACGASVDLKTTTRPVPEALKPDVELAIKAGRPGPLRFCQNPDCSAADQTTAGRAPQKGNTAVFFGLQRQVLQTEFHASQPGVKLYLTDYESPTFTKDATNSLGRGWRSTAGSGSIHVGATDRGPGVSRIAYKVGNRPARSYSGAIAATGITLSDSTAQCTGGRASRCPATWAQDGKPTSLEADRSYSTASFPEGVNLFGVTATDVVTNASAESQAFDALRATPTKIDRTKPVVSNIAGSLAALNGKTVTTGDQVTATLAATDALAGIRRITLRDSKNVDLVVATTGGCSTQDDETFGDCPQNLTGSNAPVVTLDLSKLADGRYTLRSHAEDSAGNANDSSTVSFILDRQPPAVAASDDLKDAADLRPIEYGQLLGLAVNASDDGVGVKRVAVAVDGVEKASKDVSCQMAVAPPS